MHKKLKLHELKIKSFITVQADDNLTTIKAGAIGSDGPPHTSTAGSGPVPCSVVQCGTQYCGYTEINCGSGNTDVNCGGGNAPGYSNFCDGGSNQITQ